MILKNTDFHCAASSYIFAILNLEQRNMSVKNQYHETMVLGSSEHAVDPFMASAYRIRQFVQEKSLTGRPHVSLWLGKRLD